MPFAKESLPIDILHNEILLISKNKGDKSSWFGWNKYAKKLNEVDPLC